MSSFFTQGHLPRKVSGRAEVRSPLLGKVDWEWDEMKEDMGMAMPKIMEEGSSIQLTKKNLQMDLNGERGNSYNECYPMVQGYMTTVPIR